jgi:hypothetical protein
MQALGRLLKIVTRMRAPGTQLIIKAVAVFAMTLVLSVSAMAADNPEAVVREFENRLQALLIQVFSAFNFANGTGAF